MPKVSELARITIRDGAVWRACTGCGSLTAMAPEVHRCEDCTTPDPGPALTLEPAGAQDMTAVRQITALLRDIPRPDTPDDERAAWFDRKAQAFDAIAAKDPLLAEEAAELAELARCRAEELRRGWSA